MQTYMKNNDQSARLMVGGRVPLETHKETEVDQLRLMLETRRSPVNPMLLVENTKGRCGNPHYVVRRSLVT